MTSRSRSSSSSSRTGLGEDVGQDVERQRPVVLQHARIIGGRLHAGGGIDLAAGRFDLLGDRRAERRRVPLKAMCSRKCAMPFSSARSSRAPALTQMPRATVSRCGMAWVMTVMPLRKAGDLDAHDSLGVRRLAAMQDEIPDRFDGVGQDCEAFFGRRASGSGAVVKAGLMPLAFSTASGNLAGCAVASVTIGLAEAGMARGRPHSQPRVCGSRSSPVSARVRRIVSAVSASPVAPESNSCADQLQLARRRW